MEPQSKDETRRDRLKSQVAPSTIRDKVVPEAIQQPGPSDTETSVTAPTSPRHSKNNRCPDA